MPGQARSGQARPGQARPGPGQARPGQARPGQARPGQARPGQARPGQARQKLNGLAYLVLACTSLVNSGCTWPDLSWPGQDRPGQARPDQSRPGQARQPRPDPTQLRIAKILPSRFTQGENKKVWFFYVLIFNAFDPSFSKFNFDTYLPN